MNALYAALIGLALALLEQLFLAHREQRARRQEAGRGNADVGDGCILVEQVKDGSDAK